MERVDNLRIEQLCSVHDFESIVERITQEMRATSVCWEYGTSDELKGCWRPGFVLSVAERTFDNFFNSPQGYRGRFYEGIDEGEAANRCALDALNENLLAAWDVECRSKARVRLSLSLASAKIWICQKRIPWGKNAISVKRWDSRGNASHGWKKRKGRTAPMGRHLEVKGGWLDGSNCEQVSKRKECRSWEISNLGFS